MCKLSSSFFYLPHSYFHSLWSTEASFEFFVYLSLFPEKYNRNHQRKCFSQMENKPNVGVSLFYACNNNSNFKTLLYMPICSTCITIDIYKIKCKELISMQNCKKDILQTLISCFYFMDG